MASAPPLGIDTDFHEDTSTTDSSSSPRPSWSQLSSQPSRLTFDVLKKLPNYFPHKGKSGGVSIASSFDFTMSTDFSGEDVLAFADDHSVPQSAIDPSEKVFMLTESSPTTSAAVSCFQTPSTTPLTHRAKHSDSIEIPERHQNQLNAADHKSKGRNRRYTASTNMDRMSQSLTITKTKHQGLPRQYPLKFQDSSLSNIDEYLSNEQAGPPLSSSSSTSLYSSLSNTHPSQNVSMMNVPTGAIFTNPKAEYNPRTHEEDDSSNERPLSKLMELQSKMSDHFRVQSAHRQSKYLEEVSTFMDAVCMGDYDCVRNMLLGNASLVSANDPEEEGDYTSLFFAATSGHADLCKLLLQFSANPHRVSATDHSTALCCAISHGQYAVCDVLLDAKSDPNHLVKTVVTLNDTGSKSQSYTPLGLAAEQGHHGMITLLLSHKAKADIADNYRQTPLFLATRAGKLDCVTVLLGTKASIDILPPSVSSLLVTAAQSGNMLLQKMLTDHTSKSKGKRDSENGTEQIDIQSTSASPQLCSTAEIRRILASLTQVINQSRNAGEAATYKQLRMRTCAILQRQYSSKKWTAWFKRASKRIVSATHSIARTPTESHAISYLTSRKGDASDLTVEQLDSELIEAVYDSHLDEIERLAHLRADFNCVDADGYTPLQIACAMGDIQCVKCVVKRTMELDQRDHVGATALMMAAQNGAEDVVKFLIRCRADPKLSLQPPSLNNALASPHANKKAPAIGSTALHVAAANNHAGIVALLIRHSVNVNALNCLGYSAIHEAAENGSSHVVQILLRHKVNPTICNAVGLSPVHLAAQTNHVRVLNIFIAGKAPMSQLSPKGTPKDVAKKSGAVEAVALLEKVT